MRRCEFITVELTVCPAIFECDVLSLEEADFGQAVAKRYW